jgi:hypothetical protein
MNLKLIIKRVHLKCECIKKVLTNKSLGLYILFGIGTQFLE